MIRSAVLAASLALAPVGLGQEADAVVDLDPADPDLVESAGLRWRVRGGAWAPRLGGTVQLGPGGGGVPARVIDYEDDAPIDDAEATPFAELEFGVPRAWSARVSAFAFDLDENDTYEGSLTRFGDVIMGFGSPFSAEVEMNSVGLDYRFEGFFDPAPRGGRRAGIHFMPVLSGRWIGFEQKFSAHGRSDSASADWFTVSGGLEFEIAWTPDDGLALGRALFIDAGAGIGPAFASSDVGYAWHVRAGMTWEPIDNIGLTFGYRLLELDADDGDFSVDAGLQGLIVGAAIRF